MGEVKRKEGMEMMMIHLWKSNTSLVALQNNLKPQKKVFQKRKTAQKALRYQKSA